MRFMDEGLLLGVGIVVVALVFSAIYIAWFGSKVKIYRCSACGGEFRAKGFACRIGFAIPGAGWYTTTCPKCGKRGSNLLVGYAPKTDSSGVGQSG